MVESTMIENASFPCKTVLTNRQIEWGVQNGPIATNGILPVTTLFFWKFYFSLRASYKELIWCTKYQNVDIHTFCKRWSSIWGCFFPVNILKTWFYFLIRNFFLLLSLYTNINYAGHEESLHEGQFKVGFSPSKKIFFVCITENPLKMLFILS